jgi:hypothetical protein
MQSLESDRTRDARPALSDIQGMVVALAIELHSLAGMARDPVSPSASTAS